MLEKTHQSSGWVNGNLYEASTETIGILALPESLRHDNSMGRFNDELADKKQKHRYLAKMQGTRKAILPVHTEAEKRLFKKLMGEYAVFAGHHWKKAAPIWNENAETQSDIFYKVLLILSYVYRV